MFIINLQLETFPLITLKNNDNNKGVYSKDVLLKNTFKYSPAGLYLSLKNKYRAALSETAIKCKQNGYLLEILFHGLNFSSKRIKFRRPRYFVNVHKSELYIINEAAANTYKSRVYKRRLIFFSFDKYLLQEIEKVIKQFRLPDTYTGKGLFSREDPYKIKPGKIRK